jgi:hypothetical protein
VGTGTRGTTTAGPSPGPGLVRYSRVGESLHGRRSAGEILSAPLLRLLASLRGAAKEVAGIRRAGGEPRPRRRSRRRRPRPFRHIARPRHTADRFPPPPRRSRLPACASAPRPDARRNHNAPRTHAHTHIFMAPPRRSLHSKNRRFFQTTPIAPGPGGEDA